MVGITFTVEGLRNNPVTHSSNPIRVTCPLTENYEFSLSCRICGTRIDVDNAHIGKMGLALGRWISFLILSTCLVCGFALVGLGRIIWPGSTIGNAFLAALLVLLAAFYFRLLGRLAWCCRDAIAEADAGLEEESAAEKS